MADGDLPSLVRMSHATHCKRCLTGLPASQVDTDPFKMALVFYCLGTLDLMGPILADIKASEKESWREWIWAQQASGPGGTGFRPGPFMNIHEVISGSDTDLRKDDAYCETSENAPQMIMTYTALLSLAILRDDFSRLDRPGLISFLKACQNKDGSFSSEPYGGDADVRTTYCAFAISSMLGDWSGVHVDRALAFIASCRTYEGGYGQTPFSEASGMRGPTYCALASIFLAGRGEQLLESDKLRTVRWLVINQEPSGGFRGRTCKGADACYSFWCGASVAILGAEELVSGLSVISYIASCQFKFGGIAKVPGDHPDPYHTYLSLAASALYPLPEAVSVATRLPQPLDPLLNATWETVDWAKKHIKIEN
ncbi:terpenoid cyclases/protein prenyltransferase alpha-alpha toroid [Pisolithus marmoratus]|nr:terpenoid cyclases/protein prenyltransferase alpha-alpha toroid [Pisolithus marmoratus]